MKIALVMGGFGNIGLGVSRALLQEGYDVTVMTATARDKPPIDVRQLVADRRDGAAFFQAVRGGGYEYVVDLTCHTRADAEADSSAFPHLRHLIVTSSGAAYGPLEAAEIPIREDMARRPVWQYGVDKKAMEDCLLEKHRREALPVTIFRPTVTYGRQPVIVRQIASDNSWISRIRRGEPIVTGNPHILRNFLHADDAAAAFSGAFRHPVTIGQVYNLCGLTPYDWGTYHRTMMGVLGREVDMVEVPLEALRACPSFPLSEMITQNFVYNGYYCGEKIARDIPEFRAVTDLETGLQKTVSWLDERGLVPGSSASWEEHLLSAVKKTAVFISGGAYTGGERV